MSTLTFLSSRQGSWAKRKENLTFFKKVTTTLFVINSKSFALSGQLSKCKETRKFLAQNHWSAKVCFHVCTSWKSFKSRASVKQHFSTFQRGTNSSALFPWNFGIVQCYSPMMPVSHACSDASTTSDSRKCEGLCRPIRRQLLSPSGCIWRTKPEKGQTKHTDLCSLSHGSSMCLPPLLIFAYLPQAGQFGTQGKQTLVLKVIQRDLREWFSSRDSPTVSRIHNWIFVLSDGGHLTEEQSSEQLLTNLVCVVEKCVRALSGSCIPNFHRLVGWAEKNQHLKYSKNSRQERRKLDWKFAHPIEQGVFSYHETKCVLSGQNATFKTQEPWPDNVPAKFACCLKRNGMRCLAMVNHWRMLLWCSNTLKSLVTYTS